MAAHSAFWRPTVLIRLAAKVVVALGAMVVGLADASPLCPLGPTPGRVPARVPDADRAKARFVAPLRECAR